LTRSVAALRALLHGAAKNDVIDFACLETRTLNCMFDCVAAQRLGLSIIE
jgi:hypothetical protein